MTTVGGRDDIETLLQRDPFGGGQRGDLGHQHGRRDAVLVERLPADEVAQRLLVTEHEAQLGMLEHGVADPFETGERLQAGDSMSSSHQAQQ